MTDYKEIPVSAAANIARHYSKDIVVVLGLDRAHFRTHVTTYGDRGPDKATAAALGDLISQYVNGPEGHALREKFTDYRDEATTNKRDRDLLIQVRDTARVWMEWMDAPGDGTDKTIEDEELMLSNLRDALVAVAHMDPKS